MRHEPEVEAALEEATRLLRERVPGLQEVLDDARERGVGVPETVSALVALVRSTPGADLAVEASVDEAFAPLRAEDVVLPPRGPGEHLRLNPLYSAALQERIQMDGDVPELRSGPLTPGVSPAVPVRTEARDPVVIGWMLGLASDQVAAEATDLEAERERLLQDPDQVALVKATPGALERLLDRGTLPDPEGYVRGQLPVAREVTAPEVRELTQLTPEQRGQMAWKFLSTTQGRRSARHTILRLMETKLRGDGFDVVASVDGPRPVRAEDVVTHAEWSVTLGGPGSTQPGFAFVDTAASVLSRRLGEAAPKQTPLLLEVVTVDAVDVRRVGWAARLTRPA